MSIPQFYLDKVRFGMQLSAYKQYMERIIGIIAHDTKSTQTKEQLEADVDDIIAFETKFAEVTLESMNNGNFTTAFRASRLSDMLYYVPEVSSNGANSLL